MSRRKNVILIIFLTAILLLWRYTLLNTSPNKPPGFNSSVQGTSVKGSSGMVSSASSYASYVGLDILKKGGNAIDAAVAMGFALAVTYPQAGNIGGGGFIVLRTKDNKITSVDFREKAPLLSHRDMFLDEKGDYDPDKSQFGHLSSGVPGSVAGLLYALEKYGTMSKEEILEPSIKLAEDGFIIEKHFAQSLNSNHKEFSEFESTRKIFTQKGGFREGGVFRQPDLANTLKLIMIHGKDGFYSGITAELIEKEMRTHGGLLTKEDLISYDAVERDVISANYKGYDIYSMGPPSSGGVALITLLNMVEFDPVPDLNSASETANYAHLLAESMKRVFADRSEYLGDPAFYDVPVRDLISKNYARERRKQITDTALSGSLVRPGLEAYYKESGQTTHYSVIDAEGNMVSVTTTLNNTFGSFVVIGGAGFLMNDEMDDFSSKPGIPNMYGLLGSEANSIQPGKRMLSSMTPTLIMKDGKPFMILGSPGGGRIITTVFQTILKVIDLHMPLSDAIDKPRFHHQWIPEYLQYESGAFSDEVIRELISKGHMLEHVSDFGRVDGILIDWDARIYYGHSDRRGNGIAVGY